MFWKCRRVACSRYSPEQKCGDGQREKDRQEWNFCSNAGV
jgi:hypothetical protein